MLLKVMTFNVRYASSDTEGDNIWEKRAPLNVAVIRKQVPDLIGLQECETDNLLTYQQHLPGYARLLGSAVLPGEEPCTYNAIFWRPERLDLLASGGV
jgi:endonuclease/exonuclease/phosphatase family metal-dependent hydrolase